MPSPTTTAPSEKGTIDNLYQIQLSKVKNVFCRPRDGVVISHLTAQACLKSFFIAYLVFANKTNIRFKAWSGFYQHTIAICS